MPGRVPENLTWKTVDGVTVVQVECNEVRQPGPAQELGQELYALVDPGGHTRLIVDFDKTHYLCSTAFGVIATLHKKATAAGGKLALCGLREELMAGARIICLDQLVGIYPTEREALRAF